MRRTQSSVKKGVISCPKQNRDSDGDRSDRGTVDLAGPGAIGRDADSEIALLQQQLRLMEQKLDKLQSQTAANTAAAAKANAKAEDAKASTKATVANANAAIPVKGRDRRRPVRS